MDEIRRQLAAYGYTITPTHHVVTPGGKQTQVIIRKKINNVRYEAVAGDNILWTGREIGTFLEKFWYAKPL